MKIQDPGTAVLTAACSGKDWAIDQLVASIQPGIYNLAVRMLGNHDDAAEASQEILLKVITHLSSFRGEAAFTTWVFSIAKNHLLRAATRARESPEVTLDALAEKLELGLAYGRENASEIPGPDDRVAAYQIAIACTQSMLMALEREERLVYILDAVFGLSSSQAAEVLEITSAAFRQRLSRVRKKLDGFTHRHCALVSPEARCSCEKQIPAMRHFSSRKLAKPSIIASDTSGQLSAENELDSLIRMGDAAAMFRGHPQYSAPSNILQKIRSVLIEEGHWNPGINQNDRCSD